MIIKLLIFFNIFYLKLQEMASKLPILSLILWLVAATAKSTPVTLEKLDSLQQLDTVPENMINFVTNLNSSNIYEVSPDILPEGENNSQLRAQDYVIIPKSERAEESLKFPFLVRVTFLRINITEDVLDDKDYTDDEYDDDEAYTDNEDEDETSEDNGEDDEQVCNI